MPVDGQDAGTGLDADAKQSQCKFLLCRRGIEVDNRSAELDPAIRLCQILCGLRPAVGFLDVCDDRAHSATIAGAVGRQ